MERTRTPRWRMFRRIAYRSTPVTTPRATTSVKTETGQRGRFEAFRAQTFPHLEAIYSDAFCLTGSREEASDLTFETYFRAFLDYQQFQHRAVFLQSKTQSTRAWLTKNMHHAFCAMVLARAGHSQTLIGDRS